MLKKSRLFLISLVSLLMVSMFSLTAYAATWSSTDNYGNWSNAGYTVYNDVWGSGAGPQSIWANTYSNWGVWANHPNTGGIKAYPNSTKYIGKTLSSINSCTSSFNVTLPSSASSAAFETAYDIWTNNNSYEIMLWMNTYNVGPLGTLQATVTVGGHAWKVYKGNNNTNPVYSFVRTSNTNSGTVDIKAILNWINTQGWFSGTQTLGNVQFGFEITSSSGGMNFACNNYSVTSN